MDVRKEGMSWRHLHFREEDMVMSQTPLHVCKKTTGLETSARV